MQTADLIPALKSSFARCELVDGAIARCEHEFNGRLRSVFFVKASDRLPGLEEVQSIQSDVVAPSYFASMDESRWNHYLVFVVPNHAGKNDEHRKSLIERNTSYARKLVIPYSELNSFLNRRIRNEFSTAQNANALQQIWGNLLREAGLEAVDSDEPRASVIRSIKSGSKPASERVVRPVTDTQPLAFLKRIDIREFGGRSLKGSFEFGKVNLIRGVNGSGKTSLLEAIEHFLCGGTARAKGSERLDASAVFSSSERSIHFQQRPASYYQQRDLKWYGRKVVQRNRLFEAFARYNFLNADAAVDFARDETHQDLASVLSRVALGPDAGFVWDRVQQIRGDIAPQLGALDRDIAGVDDRIDRIRARLSALKLPAPEVSSRSTKISEILSGLGWRDSFGTRFDISGVDRLGGLRFLLDAAPVDLPASLEAVNEEITRIDAALGQVREIEAAARVNEAKQAELEALAKETESLARGLKRLHEYKRVGFADLVSKLSELNKEESATLPEREVIGRLRTNIQRLGVDVADTSTSLAGLATALRLHVDRLQGALDAANAAFGDLYEKSKERRLLTAQIRGIGLQLLHEHSLDRCPLCNTSMSAADLLRRIEDSLADQQAVDVARMEEERTKTSTQLSSMLDALGSVEAILASYGELSGLTVPAILDLVEEADKEKARRNAERVALLDQSQRMQAEGFSLPELMSLMARCANEMGAEIGGLSVTNELLDKLESHVAVRRLSIHGEGEQSRKGRDEIRARLVEFVISASGEGDVERAKSKLEDRSLSLRHFCKFLSELPKEVQNAARSDLRGFIGLARTAYSQIVALSEEVREAQSRNSEIWALNDELDSAVKLAAKLKAERNNLQGAYNVLGKIMKEHSLDRGLKDFLASNLSSIQSIFERIHVPNELQLSNLSGCELVRKADGRPASLFQVSTGQRAALVLSVFLTLNMSLRAGPPMMLVDDPVAHVDDMNSLALLDYLADIAETGSRQIFFATADEKLANLFGKKMAFLGDDFQVLSLERVGRTGGRVGFDD